MDAEGSVRARIKWQPDGDRLRTMARTKRGTSLARGWRENSKLQQLAHSSTPLQFRARREFQCGLHAKPYSSSCKLPVRANHICFLPVHLSLHPPSISDHFTLAIPVFPLPSVLCFSLFSSLSLSLSLLFSLCFHFSVFLLANEEGERARVRRILPKLAEAIFTLCSGIKFRYMYRQSACDATVQATHCRSSGLSPVI